MKLKLFTNAALLTTASFVAPVNAQDSQPVRSVTPSVQSQQQEQMSPTDNNWRAYASPIV